MNAMLAADGAESDNIAIGRSAMGDADNDGVAKNIVIGNYAGDGMGSSDAAHANNIFIGYDAGGGTWSGDEACNSNILIGNYCADDAMAGAYENTIIGDASATVLSSGDVNTGVGKLSLRNLTTGNGNTTLGYNTTLSGSGVEKEMILAANTAGAGITGAGTETCRLGCGTDYITNDFGENATWTHSSDVRIKKDIEDNELGLDFINDIRTVTFKKKASSEYPEEFEQHNANQTERSKPNRIHYGFIAQEVKKAMDKAGHSEFPVWSENRDGMQELGEAEFITPLIKAVQELSAKVEELEAKIN